MSSVKEMTGELMKQDLYKLLDIEPTASEKTIKKAYRKQALKCHPDKNPDNPKAAELFLKLSKILEILCDAEAKKTYDKLLRARAAAALRSREYDSKRKKLKDDLEAREKAVEDNKVDIQQDMAKLQAEIERLRREGSRQLEEEQEIMREQLKKEMQGLHVEEPEDDGNCRLKVRWKASSSSDANYDDGKLDKLFSKYGIVTAIVISKKKGGSALIEFSDPQAASKAALEEKGSSDCPLTVKLLGTNLGTPQASADSLPSKSSAAPSRGSAAPSRGPAAPSQPPQSQASFNTFESLVLRNLRQAQERQKLTADLEASDEAVSQPENGAGEVKSRWT